MKKSKGILSAICFLWISLTAFAQENDFGSWFSVELSGKLTKNLSAEFEEEIRLFQNMGKIDRLLTSPGINYKISKFLKTGVGYAWIYGNDLNDEVWRNRHRFYGYVQGKAELGRFTFSLRERFQTTFYKEKKQQYRNYLRSKLEVDYDIRGFKGEPYLAAEMHNRLNNPDGNRIENLRYTLGMQYPFSKKLAIDGFLRLNQDINVKNPVNMFIVGACLKIDL